MTRASDLGEEGGSSELLSDEYAFSGVVYAYLVGKYGKDAVLAFYRSYADVPAFDLPPGSKSDPEGGLSGGAFQELRASYTRTALERFFGLSLSDLEKAAKDSIRK
jgi:hypothetical protein